MIEIREYTKEEISDILHTNGKQGIDRKLNRYGIEFTSNGRGANLMYSINKITNPLYRPQKLDKRAVAKGYSGYILNFV